MDDKTREDILNVLRALSPEELNWTVCSGMQLVMNRDSAWLCGMGDPTAGFFMLGARGFVAPALFNIRESFNLIAENFYSLGEDNAKGKGGRLGREPEGP